jgi:hypothetical protein
MTQAQQLANLSQAFTAGGFQFRDKIINGNFDIWQRGTSLSAAASSRYLADRWKTDAIGTTVAPSQQAFTLGQTAVPGEPTSFHRAVVASSAGASNYANFQQLIEGVRTFAGQTVTLSFWAKADAAKNIAVELAQIFGGGGSPSSPVFGIGAQLCALTTSWKQFKLPVTIPSIAGKTLGTDGTDNLALLFWLDAGSSFNARTATLGQQSGTFDIAQVRLEVGTVATPFEPRPPQVELALCQRYFFSTYAAGDYPGKPSASFNGAHMGRQPSYGSDNYTILGRLSFPVAMRTTPSLTVYSPYSGTAGRVAKTDATDIVATGNWGGPTGMNVQVSNVSIGPGTDLVCHCTASAEL